MLNIPNSSLPRIVIIGCGFGGLKFSKHIDSTLYQVVLIDKSNYHTFQPLLYQVASSGLEADSIVYPIRKIFKRKKNFHVRITEVLEISSSKNLIKTKVGDLLYDYLIIATGASTNFFGLKNVELQSVPMKTIRQSLNLRSLIIQNFEDSLITSDLQERERLMNFVIVGGGATGVELAGALSELKEHILPMDYPDLDIRSMKINLLEASSKLLGNMSNKSSQRAFKDLKKMGVQIWLNTTVKDYSDNVVITNNGNFSTNCMIWAAGVIGSFPKGIEGTIMKGNRINVNSQNLINGHHNIYAIGDCAYQESKNYINGLPMLASVAEQQGKHLALNLNKLAKNKSFSDFCYKDKGSMATIGRNKAVVDLKNIKYGGVLGWLTWMFVHLMLLVDFRSRLVVFINWVWSYFNYDKGTRLIIRPYEKTHLKENRDTMKSL